MNDAASNLDDVLAQLLDREPIFHRPHLGTTRADYEAQTADDFWEAGASRQVYGRDHVLDSLVRRGKVPGDEYWTISDASCRPLGDRTYALTYQLDHGG
ncbi:MAG: hypothetical protein JO130_06895 [Solirubrobacterales bacterium]|nr:hypothetical protein [Solirubrobacterales bacterium]